MSKLVSQRTVINQLTGEVLHSEKQVINVSKLDKEPPFVKMYINDIAMWQGLSSGEASILHHISSSVDYDGVVSLAKYHKDKIKDSLNVSDGFIRNTLSKLVSKNILLKTEKYSGVYKLNPYWFGRGDWKDIIEQRKAFVIQITKAYGMELPPEFNPVSFLSVQQEVEKQGQQRLID